MASVKRRRIPVDSGFHGETRLDGLKFVGIFHWPGPIHEGKGEALLSSMHVRLRNSAKYCSHHVRPGHRARSDCIQVFSTTVEKLNYPIFAPSNSKSTWTSERRGWLYRELPKGRGEPIVNSSDGPAASCAHRPSSRVRILTCRSRPGMTTALGSIQMKLTDTYGQFANIT